MIALIPAKISPITAAISTKLQAIDELSLAYRKAKQKGRKPIRWAVIAAVTFLLTEIFIIIGFAFTVALGVSKWGWSESVLYRYSAYLKIVTLVAGIFTALLVLLLIKKVPDKSVDKPPTPPTFGENQVVS